MLELAIGLALLTVVVSLFIPVYVNFEHAKVDSWETITYRVMDSMMPFQATISHRTRSLCPWNFRPFESGAISQGTDRMEAQRHRLKSLCGSCCWQERLQSDCRV